MYDGHMDMNPQGIIHIRSMDTAFRMITLVDGTIVEVHSARDDYAPQWTMQSVYVGENRKKVFDIYRPMLARLDDDVSPWDEDIPEWFRKMVDDFVPAS